MLTYRDAFAVSEFRTLFAGNAITVARTTVQSLALSALVYARTDSPLLAALAYLGGFVPQALGAATLLSLADRVRPRGFLALWDGVHAVVAAVLALGGLPVWGMLVLIVSVGVVDAVAAAVRTALLADVLPRDAYVLGRSVLNVSVGAMQIVGYAVGGSLLAFIGARPALLVSGALALAAAAVTRWGLHPRARTAAGRPSVAATVRGNRRLLGDRVIRPLLLAQWVPNGLIVGAEALFVPYAGSAAVALFVAAALGMLLGDVVVGRWIPAELRFRMVVPLRVLLAVPYLAFAARPSLVVGAVSVVVASIGFSATLGLQERLLAVVPEDLRGHALGLAGSGMMTMQAVAAALAGLVAEAASPGVAMATTACASLAVTASLAPALRAREAARPTPGAAAGVPPRRWGRGSGRRAGPGERASADCEGDGDREDRHPQRDVDGESALEAEADLQDLGGQEQDADQCREG